MGDKQKAKEFGDRAYKIMFDIYGPNHPETQRVLKNIDYGNSNEVFADFLWDFRQSLSEKEKKEISSNEKALEKISFNFIEKIFSGKDLEKQAGMMNFVLSMSKKPDIEHCDMLTALG